MLKDYERRYYEAHDTTYKCNVSKNLSQNIDNLEIKCSFVKASYLFLGFR